MGLDINSVQFLIQAHKEGAQFDRVLMLGRQSLNVYPAKMRQVLGRHELPAQAFAPPATGCDYAEPCFQALGAKSVESMDASDFEGAQWVHDLNRPIPPELCERFDVVWDGGTLEHVFNFPLAVKNAMEMVRPGGRLFIHNCLNNVCGHGFYQFSPELFYRVFSQDNGFEVEHMVAHAIGPYGRWFAVADPDQIRSRVELITFVPMQLMVQARRVRVAPIFETPPQQSDYSALWQAPGGAVAQNPGHSRLRRLFPGLARLVHALLTGLEFYHRQSTRNRKFFRPVRRP